MINTTAEALAPKVERLTGGRVALRILSNLADRRLARATVSISADALGEGGHDGAEVARGIAAAYRFAYADPHRAATHNKGIMNGIDAVALATGNDWRALEVALASHRIDQSTGRCARLCVSLRTIPPCVLVASWSRRWSAGRYRGPHAGRHRRRHIQAASHSTSQPRLCQRPIRRPARHGVSPRSTPRRLTTPSTQHASTSSLTMPSISRTTNESPPHSTSAGNGSYRTCAESRRAESAEHRGHPTGAHVHARPLASRNSRGLDRAHSPCGATPHRHRRLFRQRGGGGVEKTDAMTGQTELGSAN